MSAPTAEQPRICDSGLPASAVISRWTRATSGGAPAEQASHLLGLGSGAARRFDPVDGWADMPLPDVAALLDSLMPEASSTDTVDNERPPGEPQVVDVRRAMALHKGLDEAEHRGDDVGTEALRAVSDLVGLAPDGIVAMAGGRLRAVVHLAMALPGGALSATWLRVAEGWIFVMPAADGDSHHALHEGCTAREARATIGRFIAMAAMAGGTYE